MGIVWSFLLESPLVRFLLSSQYNPIEYPSEGLIARAAIIAQQQRRVMMEEEENHEYEDDDADLASSISSLSESEDDKLDDNDSDCTDYGDDLQPITPPNSSNYSPDTLIFRNFKFVAGSSKQSLEELLWDTRVKSGESMAEKSVAHAVRNRERGERMRVGRQMKMRQSFLPNSKKIVSHEREKVFCGHFTKGDDIITAAQDGNIRFYSRGMTRKYQLMNEISVPVFSWSLLDVAMNPASDMITYGTWRDDVFVGKLQHSGDGQLTCDWARLRIPRNEAEIQQSMALFQVCFSRDGKEVLGGSSNHSIYAFDLESAQCVLDVEAHEDDVNAVCYGDESHLVFSGGDDGLCKVWDRRAMNESNEPVGIFAGHKDGLTSIDVRGDDRYVLTNSKDQTIKVWDLRKFSSKDGVEATRRSIRKQKWDYRWHANPNYTVNDPPLKDDSSLCTLHGHVVRHTLIRAKWSPPSTGRRYIYTGSAMGHVIVYDLLTQRVAAVLGGHKSVVRECDWNDSTNEIVTSGWDGQTFIWNYDVRSNPKYTPLCGDEESTDEYYQPVYKRKMAKKRRRCEELQKLTTRIYAFDAYDTDPE